MSQTVSDLITQVREQSDESNVSNATNPQILRALNRANRAAANIVTRKYDALYLKQTSQALTAGTAAYDIPSKAYGRRIEMIEVGNGTSRHRVEARDRKFIDNWSTSTRATIPSYYTLEKGSIRLFPTPSTSGSTMYIHYSERPEDLVVDQGRITSVDTSGNFVVVDSAGSSLSTSTSGFGSYVNIVDYVTGEVKVTLQISELDASTSGQVTFKSSGLTRSTVLGLTVATEIPSTVAVDDYICLATGTCIPELPGAYQDYLIQHAVVALRRRFGEPTNEEFAELKSIEKELEGIWKGRESTMRVRRTRRRGVINIRKLLL